jgi:hypothetical protein
MKNLLILFFVCVCVFLSGCSSTPVPTEFSKVCELENSGKYLETTGYLDLTGDLYCSSDKSGKMTCGMMFKKDENIEIDINKVINYQMNQAELFRVSVLFGDSINNLKKKEYDKFSKEKIEFIANDNSILTIKDKVKITGKAYVSNDPTIKPPGNPLSCSINVDKIEKQ